MRWRFLVMVAVVVGLLVLASPASAQTATPTPIFVTTYPYGGLLDNGTFRWVQARTIVGGTQNVTYYFIAPADTLVRIHGFSLYCTGTGTIGPLYLQVGNGDPTSATFYANNSVQCGTVGVNGVVDVHINGGDYLRAYISGASSANVVIAWTLHGELYVPPSATPEPNPTETATPTPTGTALPPTPTPTVTPTSFAWSVSNVYPVLYTWDDFVVPIALVIAIALTGGLFWRIRRLSR